MPSHRSTLVLLLFFMLAGCSSGPQQPRLRLGSIPFPGVFTLYTTADPDDLGEHRYEAWWDKLGSPGETSRGILYTCRAGFLDLSHIRDTVDWARYIHDRALFALDDFDRSPLSSSSFRFTCSDATYEVELQQPEWWRSLNPTERAALTREAAVRIGQRMSVIVATWHEVGTWFGQETIPGISEKNSAFTWDDGTSHVVASIIAGRALRSGDPWDAAVTRELKAELESLEPADSRCQSEAIDRVKDRWWNGGTAARRDLDTGLAGNPKVPWLVPGLQCCPDAQAARFPLPDLHDVNGRDLSAMIRFRIFPSASILHKALGPAADAPAAVHGESDILDAIEHVRSDMRNELGPDADAP